MKYILFFLLTLPLSILYSQSSDQYIIATQGGLSEGKSMSITWTIGDLVTETARLNSATITQGFQQPTISVKEIENPADVSSDITASTKTETFKAEVYPNPFGTNITINVDNSAQEYYLDILDPAGNLISSNKTRNAQEVINLSSLPAAQYLLRISLIDAQQSKIFQIIKSNQ